MLDVDIFRNNGTKLGIIGHQMVDINRAIFHHKGIDIGIGVSINDSKYICIHNAFNPLFAIVVRLNGKANTASDMIIAYFSRPHINGFFQRFTQFFAQLLSTNFTVQ
ncbi:hypothetical protein [Yersinia phage PY54]|uniref:hypothetical protein n=1 Tax=Yersinia phage PY54 TaxID=172667 RepID=UPI00001B9843|nr:hypothetical protein PY54p22 [Yersinia phage PY54]CAD91783.1 hypothetical protein [Yersinia phage PY54]